MQMRKDSGRTSATPTRSGASVPCSAPYAMLDSARLLVARRMDIEPLVRIPLPVCQEPRCALSARLPPYAFHAPRAPFFFPFRSLSPRFRSTVRVSPRVSRGEGNPECSPPDRVEASLDPLGENLTSVTGSFRRSSNIAIRWCYSRVLVVLPRRKRSSSLVIT